MYELNFVGKFTITMKSIFTFFLFFIYIHQASFAQDGSKKKTYSRAQNGAEYIIEAEKLSSSNPAKSIELLQQALEIAITTKDYYTEGESYALLGKINTNAQQYDLAINYYKKAKTAFKKGNYDRKLFLVDTALANALKENKQYEEALSLYDILLNRAINEKNIENQISVYRAKAEILKKTFEFNNALNNLKIAERLAKNLKSGENIGAAIKLEIGEIYEKQSKNQQALKEYNASEQISLSQNDKQGVLNSYSKQSKLLEKEGRKKEAVDNQLKSLNYLNQGNTASYELDEPAEEAEMAEVVEMKSNKVLDKSRAESQLNIEIGRNYIDLNKSETAIGYLKDAINISSNSGALEEQKDAYGLLSDAYSRIGKFTEALETYKSYVGLVDSIYQLKEAQITASLELSKELGQRLQRINSLETDKELQEKTIELLESQRVVDEESNKRLKVILYSLSIGLILLLFLLYFMHRNSKQKRMTNQLLALKNLRTQMNPHFIFNALNSVNNFISQSDERSANRYLSDFSRLMRLVLENSEHDFIPLSKELEILNLYIGLEHSRFSEKFDYQIDIDPDLEIENYQIPPMIVQPYLENAVWHGLRYLDGKGNLNLRIDKHQGALRIIVEDDGIGRLKSKETKTKNQKSNQSTAMKNISERLKIINGLHQSQVSVNISDLKADGSGTKVEIRVVEK